MFCFVFSISSVFKALQPLVSQPNATENLLKNLPKTTSVLKSLQNALEKPEVRKLLGMYLDDTCNKHIFVRNSQSL